MLNLKNFFRLQNRICLIFNVTLAVSTAMLSLFASHAAADDNTIVVVGGTCQVLQLSDEPTSCAPNAQVLYSSLPNGIILFNVPLEDDRVLGFVGDRDSQPEPENYILYLKRVRIAKGEEPGNPVDVDGTCRMKVSTDGSIVSKVVCNATDKDGHKYLMEFIGDGRPVTVKHF